MIPNSTSQDVVDAASVLGRVADALNVTDGSGANCQISSVAACAILARAGYEVIFQMSCRDRNRIAIQSDLLGASALGLHNVLCLTGDDVTIGDHPQAKRVFDFDAIASVGKNFAGRRDFFEREKTVREAKIIFRRSRQPICRAV